MSHEHSHHVTSLPVLFATFAALVGLTLLTVYQATSLHLGQFEMAVTLGIATAKALLVALIFMQLAHDKPLNSVILVSAILFFGLFVSFTLLDRKEYQPQIDQFLLDRDAPKVYADP